MTKKDGFGHERPNEGETNDWLTPPEYFDIFNQYSILTGDDYFDLDPCASIEQPYKTASKRFTILDDGLSKIWFGNVWCNSPYGGNVGAWMQRLAEHGRGVALIFARLETSVWQDIVFPNADGFIFPKRRIAFYEYVCECGKLRSWHLSSNKKKRAQTCENFTSTGRVAQGEQAGAPSAFVAFGEENRRTFIKCVDSGEIEGAFLGGAFCTNSKRFQLNAYKQEGLL